MDKPVKVMDYGKGLRSSFYGGIYFSIFLSSIAVVFLYWGIVAVYFISGNTPANTSWVDIGWASLFLFLTAFSLRLIPAVREFRLGAPFHCPHCTQFIPHNYSWKCRACSYINAPNLYRQRYNHLFSSCNDCQTIPTTVQCSNMECGQDIKLTVPHLAPVEHPEIAQLRQQLHHQQAIERVRRQFQIEAVREEWLAAKQREQDDLIVVKNLKDAGKIKDNEERILLEKIEDEMLEGIHVDRRGGRQRHRSR